MVERQQQNRKELKQDSEKGHSTTDHVFTLYAIIQKCLSKQDGKLHVAFTDLKNEFDCVKHDTLLNMLCSAGISNTFITTVKAIYSNISSCVRMNGEFTDMFDCPQCL